MSPFPYRGYRAGLQLPCTRHEASGQFHDDDRSLAVSVSQFNCDTHVLRSKHKCRGNFLCPSIFFSQPQFSECIMDSWLHQWSAATAWRVCNKMTGLPFPSKASFPCPFQWVFDVASGIRSFLLQISCSRRALLRAIMALYMHCLHHAVFIAALKDISKPWPPGGY